VVTGASRGIGRGIALGLGEARWKVYVTGRSLDKAKCTEPEVGGNLADLKEQIESKGGTCIPVSVDHQDDAAVASLFEQVAAENDGALDLLVNNAFSGVTGLSCDPFGKFWEQGEEMWDACAGVGLRSHYVASCKAVPLLRKSQGTPLIVNVSSFGGLSYTFNVAYGVAKAGVDRLSKDCAQELKELGISTLSLWPGVVGTERMEEVLGSGTFAENTGMDVPPDFVESPLLVGRVVASLAGETREERLKRSGEVEVVAEVAQNKGITDEFGKPPPPSIRSLKFIFPVVLAPKLKMAQETLAKVPDVKIPFFVMAGGSPE